MPPRTLIIDVTECKWLSVSVSCVYSIISTVDIRLLAIVLFIVLLHLIQIVVLIHSLCRDGDDTPTLGH